MAASAAARVPLSSSSSSSSSACRIFSPFLRAFHTPAHHSFSPIFTLSSFTSPSPSPSSSSSFKSIRSMVLEQGFSNSAPSAMCSKEKHVVVHHSIQHSDLEHKIFETLKAVLIHFELDTQIRVAGGWVRDKLLGKECYDIDITLDNMLGKEFCDKVNEYLKSIDEEACNVGLSNPDQSKHLETAQMEMFGMSIDFVNLRSETYAEHSRIPTVKFGSPEEDAYRRDLTINSLFYNINTCTVEDFTGRGLLDLRVGLIATPLPPKSTFLDDPLRVLRAIRFAARLNYEIQHDLRQAAADKEVKVALANKVSPDRIGMEADLMIMCAHPVRAMQELVNIDIFWVVFRLPVGLTHHIPEETQRSCISSLKLVAEVLNALGLSNYTKEQRRILYFAALLLPLRGIMYQDRKQQIPLACMIIKESLKLKAKDSEQVVSLHEAAEEFQKIIDILLEHPDDLEDWRVSNRSNQAISAGMLLRKIKGLWRVALLLSTVLKLPLTTDNHEQQVNERADLCIAVEEAIGNLGLDNVWGLNPLTNGKVIMAELGISPGPKIKEWQDRSWEWQLCHLKGTPSECLQWLREEYAREQR